MHTVIRATVSAALLFAAGLAQASSLYERIGGAAVVEAVVDETIDGVLADPKLAQSFRDSNIRRIKRTLSEQLCALSGGGCLYTGDPMRPVHAGHHISEAEFYGMVEALRGALVRHGVALAERNQLLALLAPMKQDVVNVPVPVPVPVPATADAVTPAAAR